MSRKDVTDEMVCRAVHAYSTAMRESDYKARPPFPYETLSQLTGEPEKVCYRALERAYEHGMIEYGVSLRTGWLTDKGLALIGVQRP